MSCFGHNLHLNTIKCDDQCTRALGLPRKIFYVMGKRRDITKAQTDNILPTHTVVADCPTRWGSIHKMVPRILEQIQAIQIVLNADHKYLYLSTTWQDKEVLDYLQWLCHNSSSFNKKAANTSVFSIV